jgi:hypothetical protein
MRALGYPLEMTDRIPEITEARNIELGLGLQVALLLPFILLSHFPFLAILSTNLASLARVRLLYLSHISEQANKQISMLLFIILLRLRVKLRQICLVIVIGKG